MALIFKTGKSANGSDEKTQTHFVPVDGIWNFNTSEAIYEGPALRGEVGEQQQSDGVCLAAASFRSGKLSVRAVVDDPRVAVRLVFGFDAESGSYYAIGLNGWFRAYVLARHLRGSSQLVKAEGTSAILTPGEKHLEVEIRGQRVSLSVDSVRVLEYDRLPPTMGDQIGLYVWGNASVEFKNFIAKPESPKTFVVMQFGDPFDTLWKDVILPVSEKAGYTATRADDIYRPGVILQDIVEKILESDVVIAEITPSNPNVFYELGYAHALGKPTILLANDRLEKLPFDISGYRVVFYSDTIGGKLGVESALYKHLKNIQR